eukprot:1156415-Pelagomonas_calceolata.AAC.3
MDREGIMEVGKVLKLYGRLYIPRGGAMKCLMSRVANIHATKDGAGLAAARRECLGQTQRPDQLHQVRVTSDLISRESLETRQPWHKARNNINSAKPQWKVEQQASLVDTSMADTGIPS